MFHLATSQAASLVTVDYTLTTAEVYRDATISLIFADTPKKWILDVLCAVHPFRNPEWPSWVPDWSQRLNTLATFDGNQARNYCAAKDTVAIVSVYHNKKTLVVRGFQFDALEMAAFPMLLRPGHIPWNSLRSNPDAQNILANWILSVSSMKSYPTGEPLDSALCETLVAGKNFNGGYPLSNNEYDEFYRSYIDLRTQLLNLVKSGRFLMTERQVHYDDLVFTEPSQYIARIEILSYYRRMIVTQNGYIGLAPCTTEPDDIICIFLGAQTPFILRQEEDHWILLGECYIHGMMDGRAFDQPGIEYQDFRIR